MKRGQIKRASLVWVLDETGYHAVPLEEYEKNLQKVSCPAETTTDKRAIEQSAIGDNTDFIDTQCYTVSDIQKILRISKNAAYNLVNAKPFPVIRIGGSYRIKADTFLEWLSTSHTVLF